MNRSEAMLSMRLVLALCAVAFAVVQGCAKSETPRGNSSETHFLGNCDEDGACAEGLACVCGVCTALCDDSRDTACDGLASSAGCVETVDAACGAFACDVECELDADCEQL